VPIPDHETLLSFVRNKLFDCNWNIRPHGFLETTHMAKEQLFCLFRLRRPPIADKHDGARINGRFRDAFAAKATLVAILEHCHVYVLSTPLTCPARTSELRVTKGEHPGPVRCGGFGGDSRRRR